MCLESTVPHAWLFPQGKEFETRLKEKKPGDLSDELRISLGMPVGPVSASYPTGKEEKGLLIEAGGRQKDMVGQMVSCALLQNAHKVPPPWLIAMQRYGPPPSYPNLKIPGLNSPIPEVNPVLAFVLSWLYIFTRG